MFEFAEYRGMSTLRWDPSGTQYHSLWRGGSSYYYRVSDLVLKWRLDAVFSETFLEEYKNGYVAAQLTDADFTMPWCSN